MSSLPAAFPEPALWKSVWMLLRMRLVILVSGFRRAKPGAKFGYIMAALGLLVFLGFVLFLSIILLRFLRSAELARYLGDVSPLLESFPIMLVSASTLGILVTGFGVLLQALYLAGDMDFLMSAPIPIRAVFVSKLIQAVLPNFGIMCFFTLPILFGLGISSGYSFLYYPMAVIVLAVLSLAAAALASLLVMLAARIFPARRLAEVLGFIGGTFIFITSQSARFMNFDVDNQQLAGLVSMTERFNQPWSPLAWAGRGLTFLGEGKWLPAVGLLGLSLLVTGAVFYAALVASERLYYSGWASLQNTRHKKAKSGVKAAVPVEAKKLNPLAGLIPQPIRAILWKDLQLYRRDLRNVSRLLTPLILGVVYAVSLLQSGGQVPEGQGNAPPWVMETLRGIFLYADVALALFLGWMLTANIAGAAFSHEGKNYWIIKAAPLSPRQLLTAKFLVSYLPCLAICGLYVIVLQILKESSLWSMLLSLFAVAMTLAGLTGIYLAFGTRGAKFDWENPNQMNQAVGCLGSIAGMAFLPVCFLLFIAPPLGAALLELPLVAGQLVGALLGGGASAAAAILPLLAVEKRVPILAES